MNRILIYDDERQHCEQLRSLIEELGEYAAEIDIAVSHDEACALLQIHTYDVLFLDIKLDGAHNGIAFAETFQRQYPDAALVYITAHIKYCEEIFTTKPDGFLLKPFTLEKIRRTMRIIDDRRCSGSVLTLHAGNRIIRIPLDDVAYLENVQRRLVIMAADGSCIGKYYGIRLLDAAKQLPEHFLHCHQSILVNMKQIRSFRRYALTLHNGTELPISQSKYQKAKSRYLVFLGDAL